MDTATNPEVMDVRLIPPPQRHQSIFAAYASLAGKSCCGCCSG